MQEPLPARDGGGMCEQRFDGMRWKGRGAAEDTASQILERRPIRRPPLVPEPAGAPEIEHARPAVETRAACLQGGERLLFGPDNRGRVIAFLCQSEPFGDAVAERPIKVAVLEQRKRVRPPCRSGASIGLPYIGRRGPGEAVAGPQVMIEERQRLVRRQGGQPERQARQLHGHRVEIHTEQASRRDVPPKLDAIRGRDVVRIPASLPDERVLERQRQVPARSHEKRAAAHRGVEDFQAENLVRAPGPDQWLQRAADETRGDRPRRVEGAARLSGIAFPDERRRICRRRWLVVEHLLVHGAQLLDVEVAVGDARAAALTRDRRAADGDDRAPHHLVVDARPIERRGLRGREQPPVERGDFQFACGTARVGQARDGLDRQPQASMPAPREEPRDDRVEAVLIAIHRMPERDETAGLGEQEKQHAIQHRQGMFKQ